MAKKFVRGVTDVDNIENFDMSLTNVNDLISDGKATYVHTKKGKNEKYVNITDKITSITSGDTGLLDVSMTGDNKATLTPKHDAHKEQVIESQDMTLTITPAANNTTGKTDVRVNPTKVLLQGQLVGQNGISVYHQEGLSGTEVRLSDDFVNKVNNKHNTINNNASIGVAGPGLRQLYALKQTYNVSGGLLKTHVKSVSQNTSVLIAEEEFNFIAKIDKGVSSVNFTLNTKDTTKFSNIMSAYGDANTVCISGCVFTLSGSTLTVSTTNNTAQNYVITFSDII